MTDLKDCTEITDLSFEHEGAHIALVHKVQGGSANGKHEALITKSAFVTKATADITEEKILETIKKQAEVTVSLSMEDFLIKFFDMWSTDASVLAKVLGFESSMDNPDEAFSFQDMLEEKVESISILKSLNDGFRFLDLPFEQQTEVLLTQEVFEKGLSSVSEAHLKTITPSEIDKGDTMSEAKLDEIQKSLDVVMKEKEDMAKIIKSFQEKEEKRELSALVEVTKGFDFIEDSEAVATVLKSLEEADRDSLVAVFTKAQEALATKKEEIKKANDDMFEAKSEEGEGEEVVKSANVHTADAISKLIKKKD